MCNDQVIPTRFLGRHRTATNPVTMNYRQQVDFYTNALKQVDIHLSSNTKHVLQLKGNQLTDTYFLENGFNSPILVSDKRGLGLQGTYL